MTHTPSDRGGDGNCGMDVLGALDEHEIDALLRGKGLHGADLDPVVEVVRSLRAAASREPAPRISSVLRAELDGSGGFEGSGGGRRASPV